MSHTSVFCKPHSKQQFLKVPQKMENTIAYCQRNEGCLRRYGSDVMHHPPCSLDLVTSNFHRFVLLMKHVTICQFATDTDVKQVVMSWLQTLDRKFFYDLIKVLIPT
jgi:hypothetical protein